MCSSLYEPNEKLLRLYNNFSVAYLKNITEIKTITVVKISRFFIYLWTSRFNLLLSEKL